jgi:rSAM-associated Gly-rich repeat protein
MKHSRRSVRALARLLPSGALGLSAGLAAADAAAGTTSPESQTLSVEKRLQSLRTDVTDALGQYRTDGKPFVAVDPEQRLAWWGNGGWRNGGWRNGGWGNGGWHNGWHNW